MSRLKNVYVFLGPPGSGKGSLSALCVNELGWEQLSTGNLCRKHILEQTELGKQIDFALKSGKLVSDSLITSLVNDWFTTIKDEADAVILDGYPRTVVQAQALDEFIKSNPDKLNVRVVRFFLEDELVVARLGARYTCSNKNCQAVYSLIKGSPLAPKSSEVCDRCSCPLTRRNDDVIDAIRERLVVYHRHENDLINFYQSHGYSIVEFNVDKSLDAVFNEFKQLVHGSLV